MKRPLVALFSLLAGCSCYCLDDKAMLEEQHFCKSVMELGTYAGSPERCAGVGAFEVPDEMYPGSPEIVASWLVEDWGEDQDLFFAALAACGREVPGSFPEDTASCEADAACLAAEGIVFPESWRGVGEKAYGERCGG